jgi:hypothetical protein
MIIIVESRRILHQDKRIFALIGTLAYPKMRPFPHVM